VRARCLQAKVIMRKPNFVGDACGPAGRSVGSRCRSQRARPACINFC